MSKHKPKEDLCKSGGFIGLKLRTGKRNYAKHLFWVFPEGRVHHSFFLCRHLEHTWKILRTGTMKIMNNTISVALKHRGRKVHFQHPIAANNKEYHIWISCRRCKLLSRLRRDLWIWKCRKWHGNNQSMQLLCSRKNTTKNHPYINPKAFILRWKKFLRLIKLQTLSNMKHLHFHQKRVFSVHSINCSTDICIERFRSKNNKRLLFEEKSVAHLSKMLRSFCKSVLRILNVCRQISWRTSDASFKIMGWNFCCKSFVNCFPLPFSANL